MNTLRLRAGDWVEVKSPQEILATLGADGAVDALPFMPEMLQYCGKRFRVHKSAHKTCTPPSVLMRTMDDTVHLEGLRCDGAAHGGCQAGCLLFWKTEWLRPSTAPGATQAASNPGESPPVPEVIAKATLAPPSESGEVRYRCQSTDLVKATRLGKWWDVRLYLRDLTSGNVRPWDFLRYWLIACLNLGLRALNRREYPFLRPTVVDKTPSRELGLQAGDWVKVRPRSEIMDTIDDMSKNRGLRFDVEMTPFCGKSYRVLRRAERFIDERNGRMVSPRNPCIILDNVGCGGGYSTGRLFCPRNIYAYWHEIWLERLDREPPKSEPLANG